MEDNQIKDKKQINNENINIKKKSHYAKKYEMNHKYLNDEFWDEQLDIDFKINNNYCFGKIEIYLKNILTYEIIDHNDKIIDLFFNKRLNMFCTSSLDGFAFIYIIPNKLFSIIKNSNNSYFDRIFLCSNSFPAIITFEKKNNLLCSYSLSGLLIKEIKVENQIDVKVEINPILNIYGGNIKDQVNVCITSNQFIIKQIYSLPLLDQQSEEIIKNDNKIKNTIK